MEEFSDLDYKQDEDVPVDDHDEDTFFKLSEGSNIDYGNLRAKHEGALGHLDSNRKRL